MCGQHYKPVATSKPVSLWTKHVLRSDALIKILLRHESEIECRLTKGEVFVVSMLCYTRCRVVADHRIQSRHQHQRFVEMARDSAMVDRNSGDAVVSERCADVAEKSRGLQDRVDQDRLEDVELEVAGAARDGHRRVVAHHLRCYHRHRLTLRRIHLACYMHTVTVWLSNNVVVHVNKVTPRHARLVHRWVTIQFHGYTIVVFNQPPMSTQPGHPSAPLIRSQLWRITNLLTYLLRWSRPPLGKKWQVLHNGRPC